MSSTVSTGPSTAIAQTGRWTLAQSGDPASAAQALRELAERYWYPVYAWWRAGGISGDDAAAATESCFGRWLASEPPRAEDPGVGRFREWLPARLALAAERGIEPAQNPGITIDRELAAQRFAKEKPLERGPLFQRRWALTILESTIGALRAEYAAAGKETMIPLLLPMLGFSSHGEGQYARGARETGLSEGAFRKVVFEFRKRYRELLLATIGDTVADAAEISDELTALLCASS